MKTKVSRALFEEKAFFLKFGQFPSVHVDHTVYHSSTLVPALLFESLAWSAFERLLEETHMFSHLIYLVNLLTAHLGNILGPPLKLEDAI